MIKRMMITLMIVLAFSLVQAEGKEKITFKSKTVTTFGNILDGLDNDKDVEVWGFLEIPTSAGGFFGKKIEGPVPAIVFVHGSSGIKPKRHDPWLEIIRSQGIATFQLDCYKPRGFEKAQDDGFQNVTTADMAVDAYMALKYLCSHPKIDKDRIGIMGESKGGAVALFTAWKPVRDAINVGTFGLHIPLYHACPEFELFEFTGAPMLSMIGEKDNYTPAAPCVDLFKKLQDAGYDATVVVYPGAYHCFDAHYEVQKFSDIYSLYDCRWRMEGDGDLRETTSGLEIYTDKDPYGKCWKKGVTLGRNDSAKSKAEKEFKAFVTRVFKLSS